MAECIERDAFLEDVEKRYCLPCKEGGKDHNGCMCRACWVDDMCGEVIGAPAAVVAPVVHGRWVDNGIPGSMLSGCSVCGFTCGAYSFFYCPNCGARMDGEA